MTLITSIIKSDAVFALLIIIPTLSGCALFGAIEYVLLHG